MNGKGEAGRGDVGGADGGCGVGSDGIGGRGDGKAGLSGLGGGGDDDGGSSEGGGGGDMVVGGGGRATAICLTLNSTPPLSIDSVCPAYSCVCHVLFSDRFASTVAAALASAADIVTSCVVPTAIRRRPDSHRRRLSDNTSTSTWSTLEIFGEASAMP